MYVRLRQCEFKTHGLERQDYGLFDQKWSVYIAQVVSLCTWYCKGKVLVKFEHSKLSKQCHWFPRSDVIHMRELES